LIPELIMSLTSSKPLLSIIIPTLNEAEQIATTLATVQQHSSESFPSEVIVVDGGSGDRTREQAVQKGAKVISSPPGRAAQMNAGAAIAQGEVLLFLHADTQLPPKFPIYVMEVLREGAIAGAFNLAIAGKSPGLRWVERGVYWRSHYLHLPYGDQALFMETAVFQQVGGFPPLPIMEDVELIRRLQKRGRIGIAPATVQTSARRWQRLGVVQTTLVNQFILLAFYLGVSPQRLAHWYRGLPPNRSR
jgi:rSAM/selenodomain-associated transferase 2